MAEELPTSEPASVPETDRPSRRRFMQFTAGAVAAAGGTVLAGCSDGATSATAAPVAPPTAAPPPPLPTATFSDTRLILSEPMLQNPGPDSVRVVWFTEVPGTANRVRFGQGLTREVAATTTEMTRMLEDQDSQVFQRVTSELRIPERRRVFRH